MNYQHLLPKKLTNCRYTAKANNFFAKAPSVFRNPRKTVSLIRTVWIRLGWHKSTEAKVAKSDQLIQKFSEEGLDIWILNMDNLSSKEISYFDFIFLEYSGGFNSPIQAALLQLRQQEQPGKLAPLVILADEPLIERSIDLIEAGADELFLMSEDNQVILARCRALLRRCYHVM